MSSPTDSQVFSAETPLNQVFSHIYWARQANDAEELTQHLMPNYEMLLAFNFGPSLPIKTQTETHTVQRTAVIGPLKKAMQYTLKPGAEMLVINFTLNGFYRLLGKWLQTLPEHQTSDDLLVDQPAFNTVWQQLADADTISEQLERVQVYVSNELSPNNEASNVLRSTIPYFRQNTLDPIKAAADAHHVSPRSVQKQFQDQLGYSAKELTRFIRFRNVINQLVANPNSVDWQTLVHTFGYHDQSHLIHDFRYFLGLTPRQFMQQIAQGSVCISRLGKFY